jgi:eukaryotic-like serine/threonine-protein kinase
MRMDLIGALTQTGNLQEARAEGESLIAEAQARGEDNGLVVAFAQGSVARTYTAEGKPELAEPPLQEAYKTVSGMLGPDHTRSLMLLSDLFDVAMRRGQWAQARDHAQRVYDGFRARLGDAHNITGVTRFNLGQALYENGDLTQAQQHMAAAYELLSGQLGAANPQSQTAAFWLAACELEQRRTDRAAALIDTLDAKALEVGSADGRWQQRVDALRGLLAAQRGDAKAAAALLQPALGGLEQDLTDKRLHRAALAALGRTPPP